MFYHLYEEAYKNLKNEICSMAGRLLTDVDAVHNPGYIGQLHALNEVIDIMNKVDYELEAALLREVEKEADYYEAKISADNSSNEQQ